MPKTKHLYVEWMGLDAPEEDLQPGTSNFAELISVLRKKNRPQCNRSVNEQSKCKASYISANVDDGRNVLKYFHDMITLR